MVWTNYKNFIEMFVNLNKNLKFVLESILIAGWG